ncbi:MAG: SGNH/GDSL hydrolase family protein [Microbacteriaceae bacterium]|nr:SGNH/GDSL hydrolase family protein [Microbacteriaceae bacterium]
MRATRPLTPESASASGATGRTRRPRGTVAAIALALALVVTGSPLAANAAKPTSPPSGGGGGTTAELAIPKAMAAAGDSISIATNHSLACTVFGGCASASWTTGSNTSVDSHFLRLKDYNSRLATRNAAFSGATMASLNGQFASILAGGYRPGYVTVLIGANDLCGTSLTDTATFRTQFQTAMTNLYVTSPGSSVLVASIPDLKRLHDLLRTNTSALSAWDRYDVCPLMLTAGIDQTPVIQRQAEFNQVLREVCASFVSAATPNRCRFDGGAVFNTDFIASDVSTVDYFHPSAAGQKKLSTIAWAASFWPAR